MLESFNRLTMPLTALALSFCALLVVARAGAADFTIDADYPGGNIVVDRIEGDTVYLHQYQSNTTGYKSYWNFRVRGAAGRTLEFEFTTEKGREYVMGVHGPAVSTNRGHSWSWLWTKAVKRPSPSFHYTFAQDAKEVRFCFTMPYVETDLRRFLNWHADDPHLSVKELCKTRKGRTVERVHVGCLDGQPKYRVLLTARHHSCEAMASYFLEGILKAILADSDDGRWFRRNVEVMAIPLMDKDGVEDGDQGKNRQPHDHNRDYVGKSIYPSVAALREFVPRWSDGRLRVAIDMHCPDTWSKSIYMIGCTNAAVLEQQCKFHGILKTVDTFTLAYKAQRPPSAYKTDRAEAMFMNWAAKLEGIRLSTTFEFPYADVHGKMMTPRSNVRAFCHGLIRAMRIYLEEKEEAGVKHTAGSETDEAEALPKGKKWKLVWSDEFDGSKLDESKWGHRHPDPVKKHFLGGYLAHDAVYLDGKGHLVIKVYEKDGKYFSGAINTRGKFEHKYGYWVARCKLPKEEGHWPAFWIFSAVWPAEGTTEIDVVEYLALANTVSHALHWHVDGDTKNKRRSESHKVHIPALSEGYHTFAVQWTPKEYIFYVDGEITWRTSEAISHREQDLCLNEIVGPWPGLIENADLPDFFEVDYVRVYDICK